ncbi:MAG: alpha-glucosidase/alpha-galactosidase, partial [Armatimonadetes bacterium]|nr:alpha-glucosidase/alpha-galactosidase [Armatimonadota bacterium]
MIKLAFIGAGSVGFTRRLLMDILAVPEFRDAEFRLMDISPERLEMSKNLCVKMVQDNNLPAKVLATVNRKEALQEADYVICAIRVGGLEAFRHDIEIPLKYGVDQCVGDTLGPGGVFYALRTIPVLLDIAKDMKELCPNALLLNYSNPMAMNCWAVRKGGHVRILGLCHGVQHGAHQIAQAFGIPYEELEYVCAGINHQTWFIKLAHKGKDLTCNLLSAFERDKEFVKREPVRLDVLRRFGYYSTESNG